MLLGLASQVTVKPSETFAPSDEKIRNIAGVDDTIYCGTLVPNISSNSMLAELLPSLI